MAWPISQNIVVLRKKIAMIRSFAFLLLLIASNTLTAQSYDRSYLHHDLMISYGLPSTDLFLNISSSMLDDRFPDKRYIRDNYSGSGIISLTYRKVSKSEMFFWGGSASYNQTKGDLYNVGSLEGEIKRNFLTVAIEGQYRYQNLKKVQLYSGVGIGYSIGNETLTASVGSGKQSSSGSINRFAWQINVIGMRLGNNIGGFIELGYGYKGIINAGLSIQLY